MSYDIESVRSKFQALNKDVVFFDNPAGTQVAQSVIERMNDYLIWTNANHGGAFATSRASDEKELNARTAVAQFLNAKGPEEIVFGPSMTTLTFRLSRSLAHLLEPGDKVMVTHLDHDANITPWTMIAKDRGAEVLFVDFDVETGKLDMASLDRALEQKPKIAAVGYASNSLGTINPVKEIIEKAKAVGALTFIDAVQYAPHGVIDVQDLDCDFLACSAYKFYGPHLGFLYGKYELLDQLKAYKVRPAPAKPPGKWETGTANFEGICGIHGALDHVAWLGEKFGKAHAPSFASDFSGYALELKKGMSVILDYETELSLALLELFNSMPEITLYGSSDPEDVEHRVSTFSINLKGMHPRKLAEELDKHNVYVWDGHYYAVNVVKKLGVAESGGMVRVGAVHYNTLEEVEKLGVALKKIAAEIE